VNLPALPDSSAPRPPEKRPIQPDSQKPGRYAFPSRYARIGALALVAFAWYARSRPASVGPDRAGAVMAAASPSRAMPDAALLGLRADYQANSLLIGWDRDSPAIASAASATFTITDGARTRTLNLGARELQHGSILYKPRAGEIKVELSVTSPAGRTASQSIRILGADPAPRAGEIRKAPVASSAPPKDAQPLEARAPAFEEPAAQIPLQSRVVAAPNINVATPNLDVGTPGLVAGNLPVNVTLPAPPPISSQPTSAAGSRELRPATPLHAPQPSLPPGVNLPDYAFDRPFQVQVEVSISAGGRVTAARLVGSSGPYSTLLGPSALNTARVWTFHPATLGGEPVPSTMVLTFHYSHPR
jgi:TonB family protein